MDEALFEAVGEDPELLERLVLDHAGFGGLDPGDVPGMIDAALLDLGPLGCLWGLVPRFVRRWLLGRLLRRATSRRETASGDVSPAGAQPIEGAGRHLDLHKHWHLLHVALTGTPEDAPGPAGDAVLGGEEVGDDLGYGPGRLLAPARVAAVAELLARLGPEGIVARLPKDLDDEVYGAEFMEERGGREELRARAEQLCRFYAEAAARGSGVVAWLV